MPSEMNFKLKKNVWTKAYGGGGGSKMIHNVSSLSFSGRRAKKVKSLHQLLKFSSPFYLSFKRTTLNLTISSFGYLGSILSHSGYISRREHDQNVDACDALGGGY